MNPLLIRRRGMMVGVAKEYINFADPTVEAICVQNWSSDGVGLTRKDAASVTNAQFGLTFRDNTTITSFLELEYFTGLTAFSTSSNNGAFNGCTSLAKIAIPENVHQLPAGMFRGCSSLEEIHFKSYLNQTSGNPYVFNGCTSLLRLYYENVSDLFDSGFYDGNDAYSYLPFQANTTGTDFAVYVGGINYTSVVVPSGKTKIGAGLFHKCKGITSVTFVSTITSIGKLAFGYCSNIQSISLPSSLTTIGVSAFSDCTGLTGPLVLPSTLQTIGSYAFNNCIGLTGDLTIPSNVTRIESYTFRNCQGITGTITIPNAMTYIGTYAFQGLATTTNKAVVVVLVTIPPTLQTLPFNKNSISKIYVPYSSDHSVLTAYQTSWSQYASLLEESNP